ncbi:three component ABC system middle component [Burkholderia sp. BCC1993]|uniref:three component ABC system middle component n=1 Tax=Burkholderia sp. BCC1993 TaxID=2817444 RepID=UPI002AB24C78|nr:three component ABC system middle component [Burkholderia sp. BCC1993]
MLTKEMWQVQNPGLGAALIWMFGRAYESKAGVAVPLPYAFVTIPLLYNKAVLDVVSKTKKGLRKIEEKLSKDESIAAMTQMNALSMRSLSSESLAIALRAGLVSIQLDEATYRTQETTPPELGESMPKAFVKSAEKLGRWAAEVSLREFCFIFHLEL